jgi:hypothetical protein
MKELQVYDWKVWAIVSEKQKFFCNDSGPQNNANDVRETEESFQLLLVGTYHIFQETKSYVQK